MGASSKQVRLAEIADLAGVSTATVSRALRDPGAVSAASAEKVRQALSVLGIETPAVNPSGIPLIALVRPSAPAGNVDPYTNPFEILTNRMFAQGIAVVHVEAELERTEAIADSLLGPVAEHGGESSGPRIAGAIVLGGERPGRSRPDSPSAGAAHPRLERPPRRRDLPHRPRRLRRHRHRRPAPRPPRSSPHRARRAPRHCGRDPHRRVPSVDGERPPHPRDPGSGARRRGRGRSDGRGRRRRGAPRPRVHRPHRVCALALLRHPRGRRARPSRRPPGPLALTVGDMPDADVIAPPLSQVSYDWETIAASALDEVEAMIAAPTRARRVDYSVTPDLVLRASAVPPRRR